MSHSLDTALSGADLTNSDGPSSIRTYYDVVSPVTVATGTVTNVLFIYPLVQILVGSPSGWADIQPGMDVWIGTSARTHDIGIYRVKGTTGANLLDVGEIGQGDSGQLAIGLRSTGLADGQHVTVVQRYSLWSVLPLISAGVIYEDHGTLVSDGPANWNAFPSPLVQIKLTSEKRTEYNHLWTFTDDGQSYATVVFLASTALWPTSSSATYAWTAPGAFTVTAGSVATATFTAQVPAATTNYTVDLEVTENNGNISTRHVHVWVRERTGANAPLVLSGLDSDSWDRTGAKLTFRLNNNLLTNIPDGSMVVIAQEAYFNGAFISSAVDQFVGWIARIDKRSEPGLRTAEPEFLGPAGILALKRGTSQIWDVTASTPANWQELPASLMSLSFAMFWVLSQRARGVLELFDFLPYSTTATGQRLPELTTAPGVLWAQLTELAQGISMRNLGCDPDGTLWVQPHPSLVDYSSRSSIVKRLTLTAARYHDVDWPQELFDRVGLVEAEAFTWDGAAALPTPLLALPLGNSMAQAGSDQKLQSQVVASQSDLNTLAGNYYRYLNPDYGDIPVNIRGNRGALFKPAQMQMVRLQIPQNLTPENVAFDRYVIPREVRRSYQQSELGSIVVNSALVCEVETAGAAAATKGVPAANTNLYDDTSVFTEPEVAITGGDAALGLYGGVQKIAAFNTDGYLYITTYFPAASPTWTRTDLGVGTIIGFVVDAYSPRYLNTGTAVNGWLITDSTDAIYRITDIFGTPGLTLQATLGGAVNATNRGRSIDASFGAEGYLVVVSHYKDLASFNGTWYTYTIDGVSWATETQITANYNTTSVTINPGLFVSPRNAGTGITTAYTTTGATPVAKLYSLSSGFGTKTQITTPAGYDPGYFLALAIHVPYADNASEAIVYWSGNSSGSNRFIKRKNADGSLTEITPTVSASKQRAAAIHSIHTCPINRQSLVLCTTDEAGASAVFTSRDAGDSLTQISAGTTTEYIGASISGNNPDIVYLWGVNGAIGYVNDFTTIQDKRGNLLTMSPGKFVNICGG